jgi:hypothetical protein
MSTSSLVTLGSLRLQAQYRSDMINNPAITTPEWNIYLNNSAKELRDILIAAYGNEYSVQTPYSLTMTSNQFYDLPSDFYKLLGVDLQYSASPTGWVSLKRFEFLERNKYAYLQPAVNVYAQTARIWYIPEPTSLIFTPSCVTTLSSTTVSMDDVTGLSVNMNVDGPGIQTGTVINSINTNTNEIVISQVATATQIAATLCFWIDNVQIDGISGWEEYVIIDAAIKAGIKQEFDVRDLKEQKKEMKARIEGMAEGRDAGQAHHVTDALSVNSWGYNQLGAASLRYRLVGSQIMLIPIADSDDSFGGGFGMY